MYTRICVYMVNNISNNTNNISYAQTLLTLSKMPFFVFFSNFYLVKWVIRLSLNLFRIFLGLFRIFQH